MEENEKRYASTKEALPYALSTGLVLFSAISCCAVIAHAYSIANLTFIASCSLALAIPVGLVGFSAACIQNEKDSSITGCIKDTAYHCKYPLLINSIAASITGICLITVANTIAPITTGYRDIILSNTFNSIAIIFHIGIISYFIFSTLESKLTQDFQRE